MKLQLVSLAALIASAFGSDDLPSAGTLRKSRRTQYTYKGVEYPANPSPNRFHFSLSYEPAEGVYSSLIDPDSIFGLTGAPLNQAGFVFSIDGSATAYNPAVSAGQPVDQNILSSAKFTEIQVVAQPGLPDILPQNIVFLAAGCFTSLVLRGSDGESLFGQLCYFGIVNGLEGLLVIAGGTGDFLGATGSIFQDVDLAIEDRTIADGNGGLQVIAVEVPSVTKLYFDLTVV